MSKVVIGIDQSYARTGITVLEDKKIVEMLSVEYKHCENNSEKRACLESTLSELMDCVNSHMPLVLTERIRLRSQGFLSENYIKSTGALISTVIDFFYYWNEVPVYSVDTRSWKSQIVGNSKPLRNPYDINPEKYRTILYMRDKGLLKYIAEEYKGKGEKGVIWANRRLSDGKKEKVRIKVNDDLADSYCIAMYGFLPKNKQKLKEERF